MVGGQRTEDPTSLSRASVLALAHYAATSRLGKQKTENKGQWADVMGQVGKGWISG